MNDTSTKTIQNRIKKTETEYIELLYNRKQEHFIETQKSPNSQIASQTSQ